MVTVAIDQAVAAGLPNAETLLNHFTAGPEELRRFLGDGPILTDDRPLLEYYLSLPAEQGPVDLKRLGRGVKSD